MFKIVQNTSINRHQPHNIQAIQITVNKYRRTGLIQMGKQNGLPKGPIQLQTRKIKHDNLDERVILTTDLFCKEL